MASTKAKPTTRKSGSQKSTNIKNKKAVSVKSKKTATVKSRKNTNTKKPVNKKVKRNNGKVAVAIAIICVIILAMVVCLLNMSKNETFNIGGRNYTKIEDYLYEVTYTAYDSAAAEETLREALPPASACSSVRNGDYHARAYDWYYDDLADFVVHMSATETRHASIGVASSITGLTNDFVQSGEYSSKYEILPLITVDGINDAGFAVNVNMVPSSDAGRTTGTNPGKEDLQINTVVRYLLDNAGSVDEAIELLNNRNIYVSNANPDLNLEFHFMLSDADKTVVVEFINNEISVVEDVNIMTNFYLSIPQTKYSQGVERYAILQENYDEGSTKSGMMNLIQRVKYTQAYDRSVSPFWYSEYYDPSTGINAETPTEELNKVIDDYIARYNNHERGNNTWQTVHASVYDLKNKTLTVTAQENGKFFDFKL